MISHVAPGQDDLGADVGAEDLLRQHHEVGSYLGADLDCGLLVPVEYMNGGLGGGVIFCDSVPDSNLQPLSKRLALHNY